MANNYGPNTIPGDIRNRIFAITGGNPNPLERVGEKPFMRFAEEQAIKLSTPQPNGATERSLGSSRDMLMMYDPNKVITIRNPSTDAVGAVGRIPADLTLAEAYAVLYSLGRQAQTDADAAEAAAQNGTP